MPNNGSTIAIPSTGQTFYDLTCLINLFNIYTHGDSQTSFVPQSFVNPQYVPVTATTTAFIVSGLTIFGSTILLICQLIMRFDSHTTNVSKHNPFRQGRLLLEDYAILIGYVTAMANSIMIIVGVTYWQFGWRVYDMHITSIQHGLKVMFAFTIFVIFSASCFRIALILFVKRLYEGTASRMRIACDISTWTTILFTIGACLASSLECIPVSALLDVFESATATTNGTCDKSKTVKIVMALHVVLDCTVFLLPLRLVWQLKTLSLRRKIEAVAMFSCGLIACGISLVRLQYSTALAPSTIQSIESNKSLVSALLMEVELCAMIMAACVPSVKLAIHRFIANCRPPVQNSISTSCHRFSHAVGFESQELDKTYMNPNPPISTASFHRTSVNRSPDTSVEDIHKDIDIEVGIAL